MGVRLLLNEVDRAVAAPGSVLDGSALAALYAYPAVAHGRPWVRANMVATLDGAATGANGRSGSINTAADREVFALLRALCDVIVVGAGTARAEGYRRPRASAAHRLGVRAERPPHPVLAVVSGTARVPPLLAERPEDSGSFGDVLLVTRAGAGSEAIASARRTLGADRVVVVGESAVDLPAMVRELARRGLSRILCEGGPRLLRDVVGSDLLDELCLTTTPLLVAGAGPRVLTGSPVAVELTPRLLIEADGTLLARYSTCRYFRDDLGVSVPFTQKKD